ncbi:hypothetical protein K2173_013341 [Erythroxylum novogranatense]|uniref:BHLH domain-containing protein n=1 Tax=Erythroxylum novogranatense TaxID=1862640 RepID=A0AAV8S9V3_9ROSI|nr:hypothetical protein K2173_013341 [Erythroxylum novogranatense]
MSRLNYEVAELTWENGQLAMHGLGPSSVPVKSIQHITSQYKYSWDKPRASGTLESVVNQATSSTQNKPSSVNFGQEELVPCFERIPTAPAVSTTMTMDALVPSTSRTEDGSTQVTDYVAGLMRPVMVGCSAHSGYSSGPPATQDEEGSLACKRPRVVSVPAAPPDWNGRDQRCATASDATFWRDIDSQHVKVDKSEKELGAEFISTSLGSQKNTMKTVATATAAGDENNSVCHTRPLKRRDKINQRMKALQKLVPNSSKNDKASMLDEVIEYLKQLQAQVQMMSRMNIQPLMMPMAMQQQLQMSMINPMSFGMGTGMVMGMGMGISPNIPGMSPLLHPTAFMPINSLDGSSDRMQAASTPLKPDPLSTFLACQSQPMTMDVYNKMASRFRQFQQQQQEQHRQGEQQQPSTSVFKK